MPRYKDEPPAVRVYTVCDESRYLIVRKVPALGCGDELLNLFATYGDVEECKPMDEEDCEPYTDVYWIKFRLNCNARFAKKKLDEYVFYGNRLQVSYAPHFESLSDTREKLEARRKEVLARSNSGRFKGTATSSSVSLVRSSANSSSLQNSSIGQQIFNPNTASQLTPHADGSPYTGVSSELDYFQSHSMNQTVRLVRDKLNKVKARSYELGLKQHSILIIPSNACFRLNQVVSIRNRDLQQRKLVLTIEGEFDFCRKSEVPSVEGYPNGCAHCFYLTGHDSIKRARA